MTFKTKSGIAPPPHFSGVANLSQEAMEGFKQGLRKKVEEHKIKVRTNQKKITQLEQFVQFLEENVEWVNEERDVSPSN